MCRNASNICKRKLATGDQHTNGGYRKHLLVLAFVTRKFLSCYEILCVPNIVQICAKYRARLHHKQIADESC